MNVGTFVNWDNFCIRALPEYVGGTSLFLIALCFSSQSCCRYTQCVQKLLSRCKSARFYLCVYGYITTTIP